MIKKIFQYACILMLSMPGLLKAQLCTGNLGDPVVNADFGPENFPIPLATTTTTFEYTPGCPARGGYSISSLLFGCESNAWFLLAGDHTRNTNGRYMVINAAEDTGVVYTTSAAGLCPNTTYQFAAWVMNVVKIGSCGANITLPNLTLTVEAIDGKVLAAYNTGDLPQTPDKIWNQYGVFFTTPANVTGVVLRINSNASGICGNAFAVDDITLRACGPQVIATLDNQNIAFIDVCTGYTNPFILNAIFSGLTDPLVQWQNSIDKGITWTDIPGENTTSYKIPVRDSGIILYRMVVAERINFNSPQCRIASNSIWTNVHPLPIHQPTRTLTGCLDKDFILPGPEYALKYLWNGPNGFQSDFPTPTLPKLQYRDSGLYTVLLTADFGCAITDSFLLKVYPSSTVFTTPVYSICEGAVVNLTASGGESYQWTPPTGLSSDTIANPVVKPKDSVQYKVVVTNSFGCQDSAYVNIYVHRYATADAGRDIVIISGDSAVIKASVKGTAVNFYWSPPVYMNNSLLINPVVYPPEETIYTLTAVSTVGCGTAISEVKVKVYNDIYVPNAFTPNSDGLNDQFRLLPWENYKLLSFAIFNRWGAVIFKTTDIYKGWDGNVNRIPQPAGVYVYNLELEAKSGKRVYKKGTVFLMR